MTKEQIIKKLIASNFKLTQYSDNDCYGYIYFGPMIFQSGSFGIDSSVSSIIDALYLKIMEKEDESK